MSPHRRNSHDDSASTGSSGASNEQQQQAQALPTQQPLFDSVNGPWPCGTPKGCLYNNGSNAEHIVIGKEDLRAGLDSVVKMVCSNETCGQSPFLHAACFQAFEETVLVYLKTQGRARGWSEKQRMQNLWTKRGYDLVYKACECPCGHGHVRKDLDWMPPVDGAVGGGGGGVVVGGGEEGQGKRKRKKSKSLGNKPTITIGLPTFGVPQPQMGVATGVRRSDAQSVPNRNRTNSISSNTSGSSIGSSSGDMSSAHSPSSNDGIQPPRRALLQDRSRHDSGGSIFQRRLDYSSFNVLPKHKINSYHIKMEDECSIGNDETRIFILSNLASNKMNRVPCVLCKSVLHIFDRYPLIDGTFFLSPRQHNRSCIQVKLDGKTSYLTAVCMGCLEGWTASIVCRFCFKPWTGSHLILGTMYSYDIFAAVPCCPERLKCNNCGQMVIHPDQRFSFFSDYSQMVSCPHCGVQEAHFTKNLPSIYMRRDDATRQLAQTFQHQQQQQQQVMGMRVQRVNSA